MAEIIWTESALSDLNNIAEYIELANEAAARNLVKTVFGKVERLANFPQSGRVPIELSQLNYREVVVPPCRIFYKQQDEQIYILFVMRQEQDLRKFMLSL